MTATVDIPLLPAQHRLISTALAVARGQHPNKKLKNICYRGGLGSGKTFSGVALAFLLSTQFPGTTGAYVATTAPQVRDAVLPEFEGFCDRVGYADYDLQVVSSTVKNDAGSTILFRSSESAKSLKTTNLDWLIIEEGTDWKERDFNTVYARARVSTKLAVPVVIMIYNPGERQWFADKVARWVASGTGVEFNAPTTENVFIDEEYAESLIETYGGKDSPLVKRMVFGENVRFEGLVYPIFDRNVHVIPAASFTVKPGMERIEAIDFGFQNNFVYLHFAKAGEAWYLVYEYVASHTLAKDQAAMINAARARMPYHGPGGWTLLADHDPKDAAELREHGIDSRPADKAVLPGIKDVWSMLSVKSNGKPNLYILDTCTETRREFGLYEWAKNGEEPVKKNDHCMDALRYAMRHAAHGDSGGFVIDRGRA